MPAEARQNLALTLIKHQGHQKRRKPLETDCIGFVALCFYFKERHVSAERFCSLAPHHECVWSGQVKGEQLSNMY